MHFFAVDIEKLEIPIAILSSYANSTNDQIFSFLKDLKEDIFIVSWNL